MKDGDGTYIWQPSADAAQPSRLLGYPVVESEDMPDIAADSLSIAFGDFRRGYLIVDRVGIRVLRDPYSLQALRAVLHDQARRRRRAGLRRDQADEVRGLSAHGPVRLALRGWPSAGRLAAAHACALGASRLRVRHAADPGAHALGPAPGARLCFAHTRQAGVGQGAAHACALDALPAAFSQVVRCSRAVAP